METEIAKPRRIPKPGDDDWVHREFFDGFERSYWTANHAACRQEATMSRVTVFGFGSFEFPMKDGKLASEQQKLEWALGSAYNAGYDAALRNLRGALDGKVRPPRNPGGE